MTGVKFVKLREGMFVNLAELAVLALAADGHPAVAHFRGGLKQELQPAEAEKLEAILRAESVTDFAPEDGPS